MKVERLTEYITVAIATVCGLLLSVYMGVSAGSGARTPFLIVGGIVAVALALIMGKKVWLLIPLTYGLGGQLIPFASLPANAVAVLYVFPVFLALKALKIVRAKAQYNWLDYILWLNLFILALAYIRNPVGTNSMGFEKMGGKPYFQVIFATMSYWVLGYITLSKGLAEKLPLVLVAGNVCDMVIGFASHHIQAVGRLFGSFYTAAIEVPTEIAGPDEIGREIYLKSGSNILGAMYCMYSPLTTINPFNFGRFLVTVISVIAVMKSGFRSVFVAVGFAFLLSMYFRRGMGSVLRILAIGFPFVAILVMMQGRILELPLNMQRTLSFLPGKWSAEAVDNARGSTEWRHEIWLNVWKSKNKYINNWWFGDGFGMTRQQLKEGYASTDAQENLTVAGAYHSLPLSTIHVVGYLGLFFFCILIFANAVYGWKLTFRARGTPYFPSALAFSIPAIYTPLPSLILTGFYDSHIVAMILSVGMMRMISRSLDQYKEVNPALSGNSERSPQSDIVPLGFPDRHFPSQG